VLPLAQVFAAFPGFVRLALSEPLLNFDFARTGWAIFNSAAEASAALEAIRTAPAVVVEANSGEDKVSSTAGGDAEMSAAAHLASPAPSAEGAAAAGAANGEHSAAESRSAYLLAASSSMPFDLCAPGVLVALLEAHEVRVRATPAAFCAPSRVAADLEGALKVVREAERRLEVDGQVVEGRQGSEWIEEKKAQLGKELEERKERDGMDAPAHRIALAEVVRPLSPLCLSPAPLQGTDSHLPCACRTSARSTSPCRTCATRTTSATTAAP